MKREKESIENSLKEVAEYLVLNANFSDDLGLFHGKMGILLFLCEYSRFAGEKLYHEFAGILLEEIYEDITKDTPPYMENGLAGIGWGIEYLVSNQFMQGNTDDILTDVDCHIMKYDPMRWDDLGFNKGFSGIVFYVLTRLKSTNRDSHSDPFDAIYLDSLYHQAAKILNNVELDKSLYPILELYTNTYSKNQPIPHLLLSPYLDNTHFESDELGLQDGWAGLGIKLLNEINETNIYF